MACTLFRVSRHFHRLRGLARLRARELPTCVLGASIKSERNQLEKLLHEIRGKMVLVARTKLFGAIISAGSGALSAVFSYAGGGQQVIATVSALVAMVGGLSAIIADYFERSPGS